MSVQEGRTGQANGKLHRLGAAGTVVDRPAAPAAGAGVAATSNLPLLALGLVLALAVVFWVWFGLTQRSIITDDGISIQAAQSVLENGYQRFPSGFIYRRGWVPHYLLAGSTGVLGLNDFSIMLPSLLLAIGSLVMVYLLAKDVLGRPWLGVLACGLLLALDIQAFYATSPRMYVHLQFLAAFAAYSAWRGFIKGSAGFRLLTFFAAGAAMLSHEEGGVLVAAIAAAVTVATLQSGRSVVSLISLQNVTGVLSTALVAAFVYVYTPPTAMPAITDFAGLSPGFVGLSLDPKSWVLHVFQLERALPYGLAFVPVITLLVLKSIGSGLERHGQGLALAYFSVLLGVSAAGIVVATTRHSDRFWFFILPVYSLLIAYALAALFGAVVVLGWRRAGTAPPGIGRMQAATLVALLAGGLALDTGFIALADATSHLRLLEQGYAPSCAGSTCTKTVEEFYGVLRPNIGEMDTIVSTNPMVTAYYLGRADGFLRQRIGKDGSFSPFEEPKDEYLGIPIIDTQQELEALAAGGRRVWVISDAKADWAVGPAMVRFIQDGFAKVQEFDGIGAYVR